MTRFRYYDPSIRDFSGPFLTEETIPDDARAGFPWLREWETITVTKEPDGTIAARPAERSPEAPLVVPWRWYVPE